MNTEYEHNYLPWKSLARCVLSLGVSHRNTLEKSTWVFKFGPGASLHPAEHQAGGSMDDIRFSNVFVPHRSRWCFLCQGMSFCSAGKTELSIFSNFCPWHTLQPPHWPSLYAAHLKEQKTQNWYLLKPHSLLLPQSHTLAFPADQSNGKIVMDIRGPFLNILGKGLLQGVWICPILCSNQWATTASLA